MKKLKNKIADLGLELPAPPQAVANYVPYVIDRHQLFISGQLPFLNGQVMHVGKLGDTCTVEQGQEAAKCCALNLLSLLDHVIDGELDRLEQLVKLGGFVNSTPDFTDHPAVINGASDLMAEVLGDKGRHARFAMGAGSLPKGVAVEIDAVFSLKI